MLRLTCCFALLACGGSGSDPDASTDGPLPDTPGVDSTIDANVDAMTPAPGRPVFSVETITTGADQDALIALTQPGDTVDLLAFTPAELWHSEIGSGTAAAVLTLTEPLDGFDPPPSAVRASDGTLHVVWESTSIRYASNASGDWAEMEVASNGREPSVALDVSGVPHVAFVRLADEVNVARLDGGVFTSEVVASAPGGRGLPWTAIGTENDRLVLVGTVGDGTFWMRANEGEGWVEESFDVGDAIFMERSGDYAFAAGGLGSLISFQSNDRHGALKPAGTSTVEVATLGARFELALDAPVSAVVGDRGAFIVGHDFGSRLAVVAPGGEFWPLVAAVPWNECSENIGLSMDAADNPIVVIWCRGELTVFRSSGTYPPEYDARCEEAVTTMCDHACSCGGPEGDECGFVIGSSTDSGNRSGCRLSAREKLCSDSTEPFETLTSCLSAMGAAPTCETNGYVVPEVCDALSRLGE